MVFDYLVLLIYQISLEMAGVVPSADMEQFWRELWKGDVKKDQEGDYDEAIVNSLFPVINSLLPPPPVGAPLSKEVLFNIAVKDQADRGEVYGRLFTGAVERVRIPLTDKQYAVKVFNIDSPTLANDVKEFLGAHNVAAYIDTSKHTDRLIASLDCGDNLCFINAYTRASESDAAGKMNRNTSVDPTYRQRLFFEDANPANGGTQNITYPAYTPGVELSYFYCKYPVTLRQDLQTDRITGRLDVSMMYTKPAEGGRPVQTILVLEGANEAGAARKQKLLQQKGFNFTKAADMKEMVFLSKHHGDIAQVLDKCRAIPLENYDTAKRIYTANYKSCFISIDVNAITKAFTLNMDYIFFYRSIDNNLCIFKNTELDSIQAQVRSLKSELIGLLRNIDVAAYDINREALNIRRDRFNEISSRMLAARYEITNINYINILRQGIQIAILSQYLTKENAAPIRLEYTEAVIAAIPDDLPGMDEAAESQRLLASLFQLYLAKQTISQAHEKMKLPTHLLMNNIFDGDGLAQVSIEKDILFELNAGRKIVKKTADNIWKTIDITKDPRAFTLAESVLCRTGTKFNTQWGLDIILITHKRMMLYNPGLANMFIRGLLNFFNRDPYRPTILLGLNLINIDAAAVGGRRKLRKTKRVQKGGTPRGTIRRSALPVQTQTVAAMENTIESVKAKIKQREEIPATQQRLLFSYEADTFLDYVPRYLSELESVADLYSELNKKLSHKEVEEVHEQFFKKIYGEGEDFTKNMPMVGGAEEEISLFDVGSRFATSWPVISIYEDQIHKLRSSLEAYVRLREMPDRAERIEQMQERLRELIDKFNSIKAVPLYDSYEIYEPENNTRSVRSPKSVKASAKPKNGNSTKRRSKQANTKRKTKRNAGLKEKRGLATVTEGNREDSMDSL